MDYAYKPTTSGRAVMAACMALERPLKITRVAFGSGKVEEGTNLADVHAPLEYVSDGAVSDRHHEDDRLCLTIQYATSEHKDVDKVFLLSEFMVYAEDPETGAETDLLYGTLGDYRQPVPPWRKEYPPSVFDFPLTLILSDEISVDVSAPAGLATWRDLQRLAGVMGIRRADIVIPAEGWTAAMGAYQVRLDLRMEGAGGGMIPQITIPPEGEKTAADCGLCPAAETLEGAVRLWAVRPPEKPIPASLALLRDSSGLILSAGSGGETLPLATRTAPGAVKPGDGLRIDPDGTLSVAAASAQDILSVLEAEEDG